MSNCSARTPKMLVCDSRSTRYEGGRGGPVCKPQRDTSWKQDSFAFLFLYMVACSCRVPSATVETMLVNSDRGARRSGDRLVGAYVVGQMRHDL